MSDSATVLCRLCGADATLPRSVFCESCRAEVFRCNVCECDGQCDACRAMLAERDRLRA